MKAPGTNLLTLKHDDPLSTFAFKFNVHRYIEGGAGSVEPRVLDVALTVCKARLVHLRVRPYRRSSQRHRIQFKPSLRCGKAGSEGPHMIGRERTGILSPNHTRAFRPSFSENGDWVQV